MEGQKRNYDNLKIDENGIKFILREKKKMEEDVRSRILAIKREISNVDEHIRAVTFPGNNTRSALKETNKDIYQSLKLYQENLYTAYREAISSLLEEQEKIERVWNIYQSLPYLHRKLLTVLYVEKEKYYCAVKRLELSRKKFEKTRKEAIEMLLEDYHRPIATAYYQVRRRVQVEHEEKTDYEQLNLFSEKRE